MQHNVKVGIHPENIIHRECFARSLADTDPSDRENRCLLIIVRRGEGGYHTTRETRYVTVDELNKLNMEVYGVDTEEADEIGGESMRLSMLEKSVQRHRNNAVELWGQLREICDETLVGDGEQDVEHMLESMDEYAPEEGTDE